MVEFGLIGRGISHSFSAEYFNGKFRREGIEASYRLYDLETISDLRDIIRRNPLLRGLNVTSPYKREVIPLLDELQADAEKLQAVNVIEFLEGGRIKGHNTDWEGFRKTLGDFIPHDMDKTALILGTGGASSAVTHALAKEGWDYKTVSRTPSAVSSVYDPVSPISYEEASRLLPRCTLIVNATPAGMHPHENGLPPIDMSGITPGHYCYDLIYNPEETQFLREAARRGAKIKNGLDMLHNQAELAWDIWTDKPFGL